MSAMQQRVQLAAVLVFFCPIKAELSHLSVEEFRNRGQGGGVRGAVANPGASSMIASTPAQMMLLSLKLEPGLEDHIKQQPCVNPYRSVPVYGWRWFQSKSILFFLDIKRTDFDANADMIKHNTQK